MMSPEQEIRGSGSEVLAKISTRTDALSVADGELLIEGCSAADLVAEHGSPLFVMSESTLRSNADRVKQAFGSRWPASVNVMFAIKANNTLAVRRVMSDMGLGGDCFSSGELYATLAGGTDPSRIAINGSNKTPEVLIEAIERGLVINIDSESELALVEELATRAGLTANATVRVRLDGADYDVARAEYPALPDIRHFIDTEQVGSSYRAVTGLLTRALSSDVVDMLGYHFHLGRLSRLPEYHRWWSAGVADLVVRLWHETKFAPSLLNIGGGYAREREPERGDAPLLNEHTIEEYAETVTAELLARFEREAFAIPDLWLEPGRYLAGNAGVLLSTVGAVKSDVGMTWVNVDASINNLPRVENASWDYPLLPASRMDSPFEMTADIVGSLCVGRHLKIGASLPVTVRGDLVAFLDAGAYAETASTQYNTVPRPATVLVRGDRSWVVKRRETVQDIFQNHCIPEHLVDVSGSAARNWTNTVRNSS